MSGPVLVTGASGNLGRATAQALLSTGTAVRVAGTRPARLQRTYPGVEAVRLDLREPATFAAAVAGACGMFLVRPPAIARVGATLNVLIDVAVQHGVGHVVFSSVAGADTNRVVPHHRVETHLGRSASSWTILRPGFFAQNLADAYRADIVGDHRLYLPAGDGQAAFVDTRDVGEVAVTVLSDPAAHHACGYVLTGGRALSFAQVADLLTRELGEHIRYQPASVGRYLRHVRRRGLPLPQAVVQTILHTGLRRGQAAIDPTLERLLGRPPRTLEEYVHDHRRTWLPERRAL